MVVSTARLAHSTSPVFKPAARRARRVPTQSARVVRMGVRFHNTAWPGERTARRGLPRLVQRFADDRDLLRFKVVLLTGLLILAALVGRVV
jgi:hypothetical protein